VASRLPWALIAVISSKRRSSAQALALRSRIVLGCAEGLSNEVAARERVAQPTVGKWRRRFVEGRCDGLVDDPRPGRPVSVTAEQVEDVVVATLESAPANATHWSQIDGRALRAIQVHDRSNLGGLRAAAPSQRGLQAVQ
jgi:hypothetical protein